VSDRLKLETGLLHPLDGRPQYPYMDQELRKVARDAYVAWQGNRYSVPWQYAGRQVWVKDHAGEVNVHFGSDRIASHTVVSGKHQTVTRSEHHQGIPFNSTGGERKTLIHFRQTAPVVQFRPLAAYESLAAGGEQ